MAKMIENIDGKKWTKELNKWTDPQSFCPIRASVRPSVCLTSCVCWNSWHILFLFNFERCLLTAICVLNWNVVIFFGGFWLVRFVPVCISLVASLRHSSLYIYLFNSAWLFFSLSFFLSHTFPTWCYSLLSLVLRAHFVWRKIYASFPVDLALPCIFIGISIGLDAVTFKMHTNRKENRKRIYCNLVANRK